MKDHSFELTNTLKASKKKHSLQSLFLPPPLLTTSITISKKKILSNYVPRNDLGNSVLKYEVYKIRYKQRLKNDHKPLKEFGLLDEEFISTCRACKTRKNC